MKRKLVLIVPVAAVTLWANSFGFIANAASVAPYQGQNSQPNVEWNNQQQNVERNNQEQNNQINKDNKQVVPNKQNNQAKPAAPVAPKKDGQSVVDQNTKQTVTPADKEKRRVALANDYEARKNLEKPPVQKEAPKLPKKDTKKEDVKKPIPPKEDNKAAFLMNA